MGLYIHGIITAGNKTAPSSIGDVGKLADGNLDKIMVCVDQESFDEMNKALAAKDGVGLGLLMLQLRIFEVPSGTKVKVIDVGLFKMKVRVLEGEQAGIAGWVPDEWVKSL